MSNGKDTNSIYDYSMIFNNINKVAEIKDDNNVNNDKDNNLYNTNLISDLDLQNFDPKRYEYYTNLVYIYNKDPKTLYDLLNKYYSIKNIKDKEKKLIRIISNYARLHKEAEKADKAEKALPKKEVELLKSIDALLKELKADKQPDLTIDYKVCYLIMNIFLKIVKDFETDISKIKLIEDLVKLFNDDKIIKSLEYPPDDPASLPTNDADLHKYHIDKLKAYIDNILKYSPLHTIVLNDEVYKAIEGYYIETVIKAYADAGSISTLKSPSPSLKDYLDEINTTSPSPIFLDPIWQLYIDFKNNYKKYKEESAKKTIGGAGDKPTDEKHVIVSPENGLEKLIEEIEGLIVDKIDDANDEQPPKKTPVASIPPPIASTSTPAPILPTQEQLETLIQRIEKLEFAIQNTPGTGKDGIVRLGINKIKNLSSGLFSAKNEKIKTDNNTKTDKEIKDNLKNKMNNLKIIMADDGRKGLREKILNLVNNLSDDNEQNKNIKNLFNNIFKTSLLQNVWSGFHTINDKDLKKLHELYEKLLNYDNKDSKSKKIINEINEKLVLLYTDDIRKKLIDYTIRIAYDEYLEIKSDMDSFNNKKDCYNYYSNQHVVGTRVKIIKNVDINEGTQGIIMEDKILNDDGTVDKDEIDSVRVKFDDNTEILVNKSNLKHSTKNPNINIGNKVIITNDVNITFKTATVRKNITANNIKLETNNGYIINIENEELKLFKDLNIGSGSSIEIIKSFKLNNFTGLSKQKIGKIIKIESNGNDIQNFLVEFIDNTRICIDNNKLKLTNLNIGNIGDNFDISDIEFDFSNKNNIISGIYNHYQNYVIVKIPTTPYKSNLKIPLDYIKVREYAIGSKIQLINSNYEIKSKNEDVTVIEIKSNMLKVKDTKSNIFDVDISMVKVDEKSFVKNNNVEMNQLISTSTDFNGGMEGKIESIDNNNFLINIIGEKNYLKVKVKKEDLKTYDFDEQINKEIIEYKLNNINNLQELSSKKFEVKLQELNDKILSNINILKNIINLEKCFAKTEDKEKVDIIKANIEKLISKLKSNDFKYILDIIKSLFPDERKIDSVKKIINMLLLPESTLEEDQTGLITIISSNINNLKLIPTEKDNIKYIIAEIEKYKFISKKNEKSFIFYIDTIIKILCSLFTVKNANIDNELQVDYPFKPSILVKSNIAVIEGFINIYENNISTDGNVYVYFRDEPKNTTKIKLINIVEKDNGQLGGAYIGDDALKMRYLNNKDEDEDILKELKIIQGENRQGKKKTSNKIEQLSNDIDNYNRLENQDSNATKKIIQQINNFENDPNNPIEELALTFDDRLVFIIATFFIRYITLMFVQWSIDINIIKTFYEGFIYYAIIYIIIFWFIVLFINVDNSYDVNYMNFNGIINSIRTLFYYFYMGTNGISRLLIHTSLIIILIIVPIILNIKNKVEFVDEEENENAKILNNDERKQLSKSLSLFTMFIWLFTSIIATKF
jgi:hypothetical protein